MVPMGVSGVTAVIQCWHREIALTPADDAETGVCVGALCPDREFRRDRVRPQLGSGSTSMWDVYLDDFDGLCRARSLWPW